MNFDLAESIYLLNLKNNALTEEIVNNLKQVIDDKAFAIKVFVDIFNIDKNKIAEQYQKLELDRFLNEDYLLLVQQNTFDLEEIIAFADTSSDELLKTAIYRFVLNKLVDSSILLFENLEFSNKVINYLNNSTQNITEYIYGRLEQFIFKKIFLKKKENN